MAAGQIRRPILGRTMGMTASGEIIVKSPSSDGTQLTGNGYRISNYPPPLLWQHAPSQNDNDKGLYFDLFDDFLCPASATASDYMTWTSMDDGGTGTNAFQTAAGGWYNIVTAAAQDDYHGIRSVAKNWKFLAGKELWFEARYKLSEATTNESAVWFGLSDTVTTGGLQTGASGPLASYIGALIWKDQATMTMNFETSNAGTQNTLTNFGTCITNTTHRVGFYFDGVATTSSITPYFHNGTTWATGTAKTISLTSTAEMYLIAGVKAGPTAAAETLQLDYIRCVQLR